MSAALPTRLGAVAVGGAAGAVVRALIGDAWPGTAHFPWSLLLVNVSGAFLLPLLALIPAVRRRPVLQLGLGTGVLGGYTTMSGAAVLPAHGGSPWHVVLTLVGALLAAQAATKIVAARVHHPRHHDGGGHR